MKKIFSLVALFFFSTAIFPQSGDAQFTLKNGIPVYYKNVDSSRMCSVIIAIKGGTSMQAREFSGLEGALLELMSRGSQKFPYEKIQELNYEKHISFSHGTDYAGSTFSLSCIDYYFDEALQVFLDCFLNPSYDEIQFKNMLTEYNQNIQRTLNNPESLLWYTLKKEIYSGHPLSTSASVLPESIENITMENLRSHYADLIDANRLFVVAAGNVDIKNLLKSLEKTLGKIQPLDESFTPRLIPPLKIEGEYVVLQNEAIAGSGHIARVFNCPDLFSADLIPARIAALMYDEVLFNIVRTMRGACYTPSTSLDFSPAPIGIDFLYRVSDLQNATKFLKEAQDSFSSGKMLVSFDGEMEYDLIEERLPSFVNKYLTSVYQNQRTCSSIASRAASALLHLNDINGLDKLAEQAKAVTADDVMRVFGKYWVESQQRFFAVTGAESVDELRIE